MKYLFIIFLFLYPFASTIAYSQQHKVDELLTQLESSDSDTTKASICIEISKFYTKTAPDSSLYWLQRSIEYTKNCTHESKDSLLCSYLAMAHVEIAKVYVAHNRHIKWGEQHIDTAINILSPIVSNESLIESVKKAKAVLSVCYSVKARIHLNRGEMNEAIDYYTLSAKLLDQIGNLQGLAKIHNNLGVLHRRQSNYAQSLHFFQQALEFFESNYDTSAIAGVLTNIGSVSFDIGSYEKSLENYHKALSIFERSKDKEALVSTLVNIGGVMVASKNAKESIPFYHRALRISREIEDKRGIATCYLSLGIGYQEQNQTDSAFVYLTKSLNEYSSIEDKIGQADSHQHIGELYMQQNDYIHAKRSFIEALEIAKTVGLNSVIADVNHNLAKLMIKNGDAKKALDKAFLALNHSKMHNLLSLQQEIHLTISEIYQSLRDYKNSLIHYQLFFTLYDSIYSVDRAHKFAEMETLYQLEQKQAAITKLQKEKELKEMELQNAELQILWQRTHSYITLGVLVFVTVILFLLYRQFRAKRKANGLLKQQNSEIIQKNEEITTQKEQIELQRNVLEKQKELLQEKTEQLEKFNWLITDSIDYASSIQGALLPSNDLFNSFFDDSFIVYFPKDVVSGDFYWAYPKDDTIIVALADCTGHGVPGGFMSMLGISALTELMGRQIIEPSDILNNLRLLVIESLKQTGKIGEHQEGMDISIISYTKGSGYIEFAGANHPIWIVKSSKSNTDLIEQKGDRMPISYHSRMQPFRSIKIEVEAGDCLYLFSDGFRHQLGGQDFSEKYGKERFKTLLLNNVHLPFENQKSIIEDAFFRWVSGNDQLDDISIIGLKI